MPVLGIARSTAGRVGLVILGVVAAGVILFSCGGGTNQSSSSGPTGSFVGRISDSDAFLAVVAGKTNVVAFVSDGAHQVGMRFTGPRLGNGFDMTLPLGARLAGVIQSKQVAGALSTGNAPPRQFTATLAVQRGGLYSATATAGGNQVGLAWVLLDDNEQRGAAISNASVGPAPPLDTASTTVAIGGSSASVVKTTPGTSVGVGFGGGFGGFQTGGFGGGGFNVFGGQIGQGGFSSQLGGGKFGFGG